MLLNSKQLDELAKLQIEVLDIIFELNNTKLIVNMEKLNIAEILKNYPTGMELDCTKFTDVYFDGIIDKAQKFKIKLKIKTYGTWCSEITLDEYGRESSHPNAKCLIFPKGKTTWEEFQRPFKEGDIVVNASNEESNAFIYRGKDDYYYKMYVGLTTGCTPELIIDRSSTWTTVKSGLRFATEEEKQKLFNAIKENGYKWNSETKTLEKLITPKFKVGDKIKLKNTPTNNILTVTKTNDDGSLNVNMYSWVIEYELQDKYELALNNQPKFKVGDKIKKKGDTRLISIKDVRYNYYIITIPDYFDNCYITDKLSFSNQDDYESFPDKFDISNLKPFDKVLVRNNNNNAWSIQFFEKYDKRLNYPFVCINYKYKQCIPYKDNEYLVNKIDSCNEYYKNWK